MPSAESPISLTVERPVAGGEMLARHQGRVVLLRDVIPGEQVRARLIREAKGVAWAELVEVVEPSPDRRPALADPGCGGLYFSHIAPGRQLTLKAEIIADAFRRIGKHELSALPIVRPSPERGYRLRARLHVRNRRAGFFRERTHNLCDPGPSGQLHDESSLVIRALLKALGRQADECEALTLAESISARSRVIHLEPRRGVSLDGLPGAALLGEGLSGLSASAHAAVVVLAGSPVVTDTAVDLFGPAAAPAGIAESLLWTRHATSFFQGNRFLTGALVQHVLEVSTGDVVVDLYSGVGLFALALAARGAQVRAVEGDASCGADLAINADQVPDRLDAVRSSVETAVAGSPPARLEIAIVDPPRTGMSTAALRGLVGWQPRRIVYVSCDPPTLARDAALLFQAGYRLDRLDGFDFFPNTPHVEIAAVFDRDADRR